MRRICAILLAFMLISGHTAGLQVLAWMSMFADRIETAPSVTAALISTIDGSKPCALCRAVDDLAQDGKFETVANKQLKLAKKGDAGCICEVFVTLPIALHVDFLIDSQIKTLVSHIPDLELPPPRS